MLLIADLKKPARWYNMLRIFRPTSPMSSAELTRTAVAKIDAAMEEHGREFIRAMDEVERLVVQLRDRAIERLRRDRDASPATQDDLERINSALSMIIGLEYPITGIRRDTLADLRNTLAGLSQGES